MSAGAAGILELGLRVLALVVVLVLCALAAMDFVLELTRRRSLGQRFQVWSRRYPVYAFGLLLVVGALLAHFFWQEATGALPVPPAP